MWKSKNYDELAAITASVNKSREAMMQELKRNLYGDTQPNTQPYKPPTIRQRIRVFCGRVEEAWLVLRGKASIYDN